VVSSSQ